MLYERVCSSFRVVYLSGILGLAVATSCFAQVKEPPLDISMDAVRRAIHEYGRGQHSVPCSVPSTVSAETPETYYTQISSLLVQENFSELEAIAQKNREERCLLADGGWKTNGFFNAVSHAPFYGQLEESYYQSQLARIYRWIVAYPNSAAARLTLAHVYVHYAQFIRGDGYANTVSDSQWEGYRARVLLAKEALLAAARLKERDRYWYEAMQMVAFHDGWNKSDMRELLRQALTFEPDYYHYYRQYADYLMPQWYGEPGEIQAFAEEVSARLPEPQSSILYFRVVSTLAINIKEEKQELPRATWSKLDEGYHNLQRLYGKSNLNANRFAFMAYIFNNICAAHDAFNSVASMQPEVWYSEQLFESVRDWANSPYVSCCCPAQQLPSQKPTVQP